jgi:hypothetical protein
MIRKFVQPKKLGRPATGRGVPVQVRMPLDELKALDEWIKADGGLLSRPQAIRRLVKLGLTAKPGK